MSLELPASDFGLALRDSKRARACASANAAQPDSKFIYLGTVLYLLKPLPTLEVRPLDQNGFLMIKQNRHCRRTTFYTRADRFQGRTLETTYCVISEGEPDAAILRVNRQAHREAVLVLYSKHLLDFDVHVDTVTPFMSDLTKEARSCVRSVAITKRASPFEKEFDRAEWTNACQCLANMPSLEELKLQIIASMPSREGWHGIEPIEKEDMEAMIEGQSFEWVRDLLKIKGLKKMDITAKVEGCMSPGSDALFEWVRFSKSIEGSFQDVVRDIMVRNGTVGGNNTA